MKFSLTLLLCLLCFSVQSQKLTVLDIDTEVSKIDMDPGLEHLTFDTNEVYNQATDGGGSFEVWLRGKEIRKISQSIFLSNAQFVTTVYLKDDQPIMIVETENQFPYDEEKNSINLAEPEAAYERIIYSWHWEKDAITVRTRGESWGADAGADVGSYTSLFATARKILSQESRLVRGSK